MEKLESSLRNLLGKYAKYIGEDEPIHDVAFRHVTKHIINNALLYDELGDKDAVKKNINSIKKYVKLLDEFPQFREEQLTKDTFPHGPGSNCVKYVNQMYTKLKKEKYKQIN